MAMINTALPQEPVPPLLAFGSEQPAERITALDAVRGFAVFGILIRNIYVFAMPNSAYSVPFLWGAYEGANTISWAFVELFVDGAMRALFSMLFGASALLILSVGENAGPTIRSIDRYFKRLLLWPHDVLFPYGLLGFFLFPLRNLSWRALLGTSLAMMALISIVNLPFFASPPEEELDAAAMTAIVASLETGVESPVLPNPAGDAADPANAADAGGAGEIADATAGAEDGAEAPAEDTDLEELVLEWDVEIAVHLSGYLQILSAIAPLTLEQQTTELYKTHFVDIGAMMVLGMALFKMGVFSGRRTNRFYLLMILLGYGIGLPLNLAETIPLFGLESPYDWNTDWSAATYDFGRTLVALGHLGTLVLIVKNGLFKTAIAFLASAGRLALTNYLMQTMICISLFYGFGAGLYAGFEHYELLILALCLGIIQIIASRIYLSHFPQGPMEWVLGNSIHSRPLRARPLEPVS